MSSNLETQHLQYSLRELGLGIGLNATWLEISIAIFNELVNEDFEPDFEKLWALYCFFLGAQRQFSFEANNEGLSPVTHIINLIEAYCQGFRLGLGGFQSAKPIEPCVVNDATIDTFQQGMELGRLEKIFVERSNGEPPPSKALKIAVKDFIELYCEATFSPCSLLTYIALYHLLNTTLRVNRIMLLDLKIIEEVFITEMEIYEREEQQYPEYLVLAYDLIDVAIKYSGS